MYVCLSVCLSSCMACSLVDMLVCWHARCLVGLLDVYMHVCMSVCLSAYMPVCRSMSYSLYRIYKSMFLNYNFLSLQKLVTPFVEKGFEKGIFNSKTEECKLKENVITFFENFADICWQLAIAEDDIIVDFDVVEKPYDDVKTFFNKYCPSARVLGDKSNTVKTLVWPCVRRTEGEIMEKGEVIVVDPCQTDF